MLEQFGTAVTKPKWLEGRRVRAIDGSHISEQGSTGRDWILHYSWEVFDLRNDYFEITPHSQGEKTARFPIQKGDIILWDRLYGKAKGFDYIVGAGGDFVMRLKHKAAKYYDEDGHRVELLPLLREKSWTLRFATTLILVFPVPSLIGRALLCCLQKPRDNELMFFHPVGSYLD